MVGAKIIFVEAVEYLVVSEETDAQILVAEAFVQGPLYGSENLWESRSGVLRFENIAQTFVLFGAVCQNVDGIAVGTELSQRGA